MIRMFLACAAALLLSSPAHAELTAIHISPAAPVVGESVTATIVGYMPDLCWSLLGYTCGAVMGQDIGITVNTYDCYARECSFCYFALVPVEVSCAIVFEAAGTYVIHVREIADSQRFIPAPDLTLSVQVSDLVPTDPVSWSAVKALYR